jgi:DNA-binding CsgD family transcriptional regulator
MVTAQPTPGVSGNRVRIAISSPEILAHIRREFASRGLTAQVDGPPVIDVVVTGGNAGILGEALNRLAGPDSYRRDPATARYRLTLVTNDATRPAAVPPDEADGRGRTAAGPVRVRGRSLTPREVEVMESISRGLRNADIAAALQLSQKTVKNHVNRIFAKLGAGTRVEAVLIWQAGGVAPSD